MNHEEFNDCRSAIGLRGGEMAYAEAGAGPVALFVHGVFTSSHLWRKVIGELRDERRCIAIDLPAHGRTTIELEDPSLPAQAELLEEFCEALGLEDVDLVANDTGGAIAQVFMARHPERVRTATFTNCDVHDQIPPENFREVAETAARGELAPALTELARNPEAARDTALAQSYERVDRVPVETIEEYLGTFADPDRARQVEKAVAALSAEDLMAAEPRLAELDTPTLIVWGTGDVFFDVELAHWLCNAIPGAEKVVEIPDARLFYPDERPEDLVPHVRDHWSRHAPAAASARQA